MLFFDNTTNVCLLLGGLWCTVVKVVHYKSEGCWFDSRWCHWNFSLTILLITIWPWG